NAQDPRIDRGEPSGFWRQRQPCNRPYALLNTRSADRRNGGQRNKGHRGAPREAATQDGNAGEPRQRRTARIAIARWSSAIVYRARKKYHSVKRRQARRDDIPAFVVSNAGKMS